MKVNGIEENLQFSNTLDAYLSEKNFEAERVAVELNGNVVPRSEFCKTTLNNDDILEIVHFVGGG